MLALNYGMAPSHGPADRAAAYGGRDYCSCTARRIRGSGNGRTLSSIRRAHGQDRHGLRLAAAFDRGGTNPRSLRNFPMQANGAEMLRIACILGTERGIEVCAPVHDAVLIAAPVERIDAEVGGNARRYGRGVGEWCWVASNSAPMPTLVRWPGSVLGQPRQGDVVACDGANWRSRLGRTSGECRIGAHAGYDSVA